ncbi:DUF1559 domain-containing protein [Fimbriiglobus ruber]|uniref:DUF1559 domain-containing protein n=1 Tax=Fimbriiglobus ruber TaxID=1908690 RepID=A0A225EED3_9BACT|nr:DUF1559 domain-containing protein [Fimbriiglobus ruber]OWK46735.1 hypothetical protein FRUB_00434 [Fimbriiglobus ruber]
MSRLLPLIFVMAFALGAAAAPVPKDQSLPPPTEKERVASENNLKQIGLALHGYHDVYGQFPNNITSKAGKPLLSWRVQLLPFLEEGELYSKFKLDEPWDSEHNKPLVKKLPKIYAPIRVKAKPGETFYQGFTGNGAFFEPTAKINIAGITDGTSNTVMIVEAGTPVIWSKPDDIPFDPTKPLPKLGGMFDGEFSLLVADGSTLRVKKDFDADEFGKCVTRAGGEVSSFDKIVQK